jgi:hypothetical protein
MNQRCKATKKKRFVVALREHGIIGIAAQAAGVHRSSIYRWADEDPDFAQEVDNAREVAVDVIEESLYTKAKNGDTIAQIFYLKARRPIFRDRINVDLTMVQEEIKERMQQLGIEGVGSTLAPVHTELKLLGPATGIGDPQGPGGPERGSERGLR